MSNQSPGGDSGHQNAYMQSYPDDSIDLRDLFFRLMRGLPQIIGLALLGMAVALVLALVINRVQPVTTSTRVSFSFPGFERGKYPDQSNFNPDDIRAPANIREALQRLGFDTSSDFQSKIRGALSIEGIVPANIIKERDRLRASGQTPPAYIPDEYNLSLTLKPDDAFNSTQRERLLAEIVTIYRESFNRTYGKPPLVFGTAFETLKGSDFAEYELVLNAEVSNILSYLRQQEAIARAFRSPSTNFSFKDLAEQTELFSQIHLNEILGIIRANGLSRNRATAMLKLNYHLRQLDEREAKALEDEKVVRDLLGQAQTRTQNYVLGIKNQSLQSRGDAPILDQGLIDSLLANDSYSFLVRRALDAGLEVKEIQAQKNRLIAQRDNLKSFMTAAAEDQNAVIEAVNTALKRLESVYQNLIESIRKTHADFSLQEYSSAIRMTDEVKTPGMLKSLAIGAIVGGVIGFAIGSGLSLLGVLLGRKFPRPTA